MTMTRRLLVLMACVVLGLSCVVPATPAFITAVPKASATSPPPTPVYTQTPTPYCIVSTGYQAGTVNIRSGPGMEYAVIGTATEGERLVTTGQHSPAGWIAVKKNNLIGWFYAPTWCRK
jgi:uncharacterized protein YgiM (DUF1202 family)